MNCKIEFLVLYVDYIGIDEGPYVDPFHHKIYGKHDIEGIKAQGGYELFRGKAIQEIELACPICETIILMIYWFDTNDIVIGTGQMVPSLSNLKKKGECPKCGVPLMIGPRLQKFFRHTDQLKKIYKELKGKLPIWKFS